MPETDKALLKEIRAMAKVQQEILEELRAKPHAHFGLGKAYWKYLAVLTIITLAAGSFGAYQYYKVLQSIIDQFPH